MVHADDCLFPECIERMVELAETSPKVGIVGSYRLDGNRPAPTPGLPHTRSVVPGTEICRGTLRREHSLFGSPSTLLMRSSLVRERDNFYDEAYLHADKAVCLELLQRCDFGFVHQVLTYTRLHDESQTVTFAERYGTPFIESLLMLDQYGPSCLPHAELGERVRSAERSYYRFLGRQLLLGRRDVLRFHARHLSKHGRAVSARQLIAGAASEILAGLLDPWSLARRLRKSARRAKTRES